MGLLLLAAGMARADMNAEASVSSNQVSTGEPFRLTVQVTTSEKPDKLPWPQVAGLDKFTVTKDFRNSRNSQTTIVNGKISQRDLYVAQFTYILTAKAPGDYPIGPIRYAHGSFDRHLGSTTITVTKQEPGLTSAATVSKKSPRVGEQVLYNLRIIPAQGVQQINLPQDLQKLIGEKFWFQRLDKNVEAKTVTLGGQNARVFDVRIVLFPLLPGPASLSSIPVEYQQVSGGRRNRTGSIFDMMEQDFFGNGSLVNLTAMASPVSMNVAALPPGAPEGFTGSVGDYSLRASVDKTKLPSGEALTLTVTIRGDGTPKSVTKPILPDLSDFELFDPEIGATSAVEGSTLVTTKTFKYVVVPRRKGEYTLGPVAFPYFDPARNVYAEAKSQPITLSVSQGKEAAAIPSRIMSQREIDDIGADIRHIKLGAAALTHEGDFLYMHVWYWLLFLPAPGAFALALALRRRSRLLESDANLKRKTLAGAQLRRRLKEASEALKQKNSKEFYKALSQALVGFASDKTSVEFRGLTLAEAKTQLRAQGVSESTVEEYERLLQQADFGQFAGGVRDEKSWKESLAGAEGLLKRLDKEL